MYVMTHRTHQSTVKSFIQAAAYIDFGPLLVRLKFKVGLHSGFVLWASQIDNCAKSYYFKKNIFVIASSVTNCRFIVSHFYL